MYTKEELKRQMAEMGLKSTDTVLIHISLKAVGATEGGADGLIDAFCEYLSDGLFLVPTHTWATVNAKNPVFDVRTADPCIGTLPRIAAFRKDGVRSLHPTHSIWAHGKGAQEFIAGEENASSPAPVGFAWDRLADVGAKILLIGVTHNRNTFIHSVDERAALPDRIGVQPFDVTIINSEGVASVHPRRPHSCSKTNDVSQFYVNFEQPLIELGAQTTGRLGSADVRVVDAMRCREIVSRIYARAEEDIFCEYRELPQELYR